MAAIPSSSGGNSPIQPDIAGLSLLDNCFFYGKIMSRALLTGILLLTTCWSCLTWSFSDDDFRDLEKSALQKPGQTLKSLQSKYLELKEEPVSKLTAKLVILYVQTLHHLGQNQEAESTISESMGRNLGLEAEAELFFIQGVINSEREALQAAASYFDRVVEMAQLAKNERLQALALSAKSVVNVKEFNIASAKSNIVAAFRMTSAIRDAKSKALVYMYISEAWHAMKNIPQSIKYLELAKAEMEKGEMIHQLSIALYNQGVLYEETEQYEEALATFLEAESKSAQIDDEVGIYYGRYAQGFPLIQLGKYQQAYNVLFPLVEGFKERDDHRTYIISITRLGNAALGLKKYDEANRYANMALEHIQNRGDGLKRFLADAYGLKVRVFEAQGDTKNALKYAKRRATQLEKEFKKQTENRLAKYQAQLQTKLLDLHRLRLEKENREKDVTIQSERFVTQLFMYVSIVALIFLGISLWLLFKNRRLNARLIELTNTDEVTELPNRSAIIRQLEKEMDRFRRYKEPCSIALLEINEYDKISDEFGVRISDKVAKLVAESCKAMTRINDLTGRYQSEQFLIIFTHSEKENVTQVISRICDHVRVESSQILSMSIKATAGITEISEGDESLNWILDRADQALYQSKQIGSTYQLM